MCEQYEYVSIGGIVSKEITRKEYKYFPYFINTAHAHGAKIHGLGFTNAGALSKYHFDSVDSSSWVSGNRYGYLYKFNGKTVQQVKGETDQRLCQYRRAGSHNFKEWLKFSQYAEKFL